MIQHETYRFDQCKVTFDKNVYAAIMVSKDSESKSSYDICMSNRPMPEKYDDSRTIPFILEFKDVESINRLIEALNGLREMVRNG